MNSHVIQLVEHIKELLVQKLSKNPEDSSDALALATRFRKYIAYLEDNESHIINQVKQDLGDKLRKQLDWVSEDCFNSDVQDAYDETLCLYQDALWDLFTQTKPSKILKAEFGRAGDVPVWYHYNYLKGAEEVAKDFVCPAGLWGELKELTDTIRNSHFASKDNQLLKIVCYCDVTSPSVVRVETYKGVACFPVANGKSYEDSIEHWITRSTNDLDKDIPRHNLPESPQLDVLDDFECLGKDLAKYQHIEDFKQLKASVVGADIEAFILE